MDTRPTNSELEILGVLWRRGPSSVRDVHEELERKRRTGYTTVLKLMQIMAEKGLVIRDEENRAHIYTALISEDEAQSGLMNDLVDKAFGGSAHKLALHALGSKKATQEELDEIRTLLDRLEEISERGTVDWLDSGPFGMGDRGDCRPILFRQFVPSRHTRQRSIRRRARGIDCLPDRAGRNLLRVGATSIPGVARTQSPVAAPSQKAEPAQIITLRQAAGTQEAPVVQSLAQRIDPILPSLVICWLLGLTLMCLRLAGGLFVVERIKRKASSSVDQRWQDLAMTLAAKLGVRRSVRLMVSDRVATPAVVGFFKTVILLPASAITKLSPEDVEALLAHELAHVRRYDYIVNFAQSAVETVLFYHPAAWWISNVVRAEREHCCDDIALSVLGDREQYARALMSLEQLRHSAPRLAMAANRGPLLSRIRRIVLPSERPMVPTSTWATLVLAIAISIGLAETLHAKQKPMKPAPVRPGAKRPIDGKVIDAEGQPVEGATILFQKMNYDVVKMGPLGEATSDSNGEFHLDDGAQIVAIKKGVGMGWADWQSGKPLVRLMPVKQIHLHAVDSSGTPVSGVTIGPDSLGTRSRWERLRVGSDLFEKFACKTDAEGRATIENIPANADVWLAVAEERFRIVGRMSDRIKAPRQDSEITVRLEPAGGVEGRVTNGGTPPDHFAVQISSDAGEPLGFEPIDRQGRFVFKHLPAGDLKIVGDRMYNSNQNWSNPETHVKVVPGTVQHVELKMGTGVPFKVLVLSPKGHPLEGLKVEVAPDGNQWPRQAGGKTDKDGMFECTVLPGAHRVEVDQWTEEIKQVVDVREGKSNSITLHAPIEEKDARVVCRLTDADGKQVGETSIDVECIDFHNKVIKLWSVTDQFGKAIFYVPVSRVKTMRAHAKSGNQVSDPAIRPVNGVITIKLHRIAASKTAQAAPNTTERRIVGNWAGQIPNVRASYPPKDGRGWTYETYTENVSLVVNSDHTYTETMAPHGVFHGQLVKGNWSVNGKYITFKCPERPMQLISTLSPDGKRLEHIDIKTWQEMRKTQKDLNGIRTISFNRS